MGLQKTFVLRCMTVVAGLALGMFALAAQAQVNVTFTSKTFTPSVIPVGGQSTLAVSLTNGTGATITGVTFIDTLPAGVTTVTFGTPPFSAGCAGGSITINGTQFLSAGVDVAANSTCVVQAVVTAASPGQYTNATANISGWNGNALAFAASTLSVGLQSPVPTLSDFGLVLLALGLAGLAYRRFRRARSMGGPLA
jgi:uncharacterized repeat protein (TIGR01451 family)